MRKAVSRASANACALWGTCPCGTVRPSHPRPGLVQAPPRRVPAPFGAAAEHHGSAATAAPASPPVPLPAQGPWGALKTGVSGVKPTSSCIGRQRGRGGGVQLHVREAAPLLLIELLKDEVQ